MRKDCQFGLPESQALRTLGSAKVLIVIDLEKVRLEWEAGFEPTPLSLVSFVYVSLFNLAAYS